MESGTLRPPPPLPGLTRVGLIGALLGLAAGAWLLTDDRMARMDAGPGTDLGDLGRFAVSWLVMMAAMMLPSLGPAALAFARTGQRTVAAFVLGYLTAWMAAGLVAYLLFDAVRSLDVAFLAWDRAGRDLAAGVILAAAAYQLTGAKARCLHRCRTPVRLATGSRRPPAGRAAARLRLRRLLRLADGGAVRPRRDEPHLDGRRRRADRRRA